MSQTVKEEARASSAPILGRREVIAGLTAMGGALGLASETEAQSANDSIIRLLNRICYGPRVPEYNEAISLGFTAYLEKQLTMTEADDTSCETVAQQRYPRAFQTLAQLGIIDNDWITVTHLQDATLHRMLFSNRQLYQKMCEFWRDHLNIFAWKVGGWLLVDDQNNVIRKHALGKFPDLLKASAHSGAMMQYLDNAWSYAANPNQNYSRELMELHTLSVNGGYTQTDVEEVTRCFTGWSYTFPWEGGPNIGKFRYRSDWHDEGSKTVLGRFLPANRGSTDGGSVLIILTTHVNTARFISRKMIHWFLGDGNWTALENAVTTVYMSTGGDIKAMLRAILTPANLLASQPRLKRPNHLFISGLRMMNASVRAFENMRWGYVNPGGQEPYGWAPPNGYPDADAYWMGFLLPRWNFFMGMFAGYLGNTVSYNINASFPGATANAIADSISGRLYFGKMPTAEKDRIKAFLNAAPITDDRRREAVVLAMCSPSFQWF